MVWMLLGLVLLLIMVALVKRRSLGAASPVEDDTTSFQLLPRKGFDQNLSSKDQQGRFRRRECLMLQLRLIEPAVDITERQMTEVISALQAVSLSQPSRMTLLSGQVLVIAIDHISLPDDVAEQEQIIIKQLQESASLAMGADYNLVAAACPFDVEEPQQLWGELAARMESKVGAPPRQVGAPKLTLRDDGILIVDYGNAEGVTYDLMRQAFQIYQDEIAPLYPGVKFPQMTKAGRMLSLDPEAVKFTRSRMLVEVTSAIAVPPRGAIERHIMKMFSYYNQPPYPFKVCDSEEEALTWLQQHVDPKFWTIKNARAGIHTTPSRTIKSSRPGL